MLFRSEVRGKTREYEAPAVTLLAIPRHQLIGESNSLVRVPKAKLDYDFQFLKLKKPMHEKYALAVRALFVMCEAQLHHEFQMHVRAQKLKLKLNLDLDLH